MSSYAVVLRVPHARTTFAAALLGRLSYGIVFLSLTLAVSQATGSYAVAGVAMALFGLVGALVSPWRAALVDRRGPRRVLPVMAAAYAVSLAGLAASSWQPGSSRVLLCGLAALGGACAPPLGRVMRALWGELVPDRRLLQRAFSLDTVAKELVYVTGPLVAGLLAVVARPAAGVAVSAALVLVGTLALVSSPAVRDMRGQSDKERDEPKRSWGGLAGLERPIAVAAGTGFCLGALHLLAVAFTEERSQAAAVAWVEASLAAGSAVGGLAYGAVTWRADARVRLALLGVLLGGLVAVAGSMPGVVTLAGAVGVAGLFVSPLLTTAYLIADESAGPGSRTRAGAWVNTAFNAGSSAGTAGAGTLLGSAPWRGAPSWQPYPCWWPR
ncbi:MFS transporter [Actinomadura kijaniata]|uniref:MFS transporter n=1 Tax=Actinomadura kijaniata TaxID=46161 RepID=UPI000A40016A|nr:MFS transporter [Actinomadura kijaniata]